jgi:DegV family protein with EDD domain
MPRVSIVTDSIADLPPDLASEFGIAVVPLIVRFGTDIYRDGVDLSSEDFYKKLKSSSVFPGTSAPSPAMFADTYDSLAEKTDGIVAITVTSKVSATYQVALQSKGLMKKQCLVEVVDSRWAVMSQGFIAIAAAKAARAGASIDQVLDTVHETIHHVDLLGAFDTLEYLERGGRIGKAQALLGSLLKVNPVIGMKGGEVIPYGREWSRSKAMDRLYSFATSFHDVQGLAVEYGTDFDAANGLLQRLRSSFPHVAIYLSRVSPVIGIHTGPSLVAVSVLGNRQAAS